MREIDKNNINFVKVTKNDMNFGKNEVVETPQPQESEEASLKDFSNPKAEALGRSQVATADTLKADVKFGMANPGKIQNSDKLFELAYAQLKSQGDSNAYEKACAIATSDDAKALL